MRLFLPDNCVVVSKPALSCLKMTYHTWYVDARCKMLKVLFICISYKQLTLINLEL